MSDREKKKRKKEKLHEMVGYTNDNNPFGDADLGRKFTWKKKDAADASASSTRSRDAGYSGKDAKQAHFLGEIEKVRKRRDDREAELAEMERLREEEQRLREADTYADWQKKEEDFHLEQTKVRSKLRLAAGRSKPIDQIAQNILMIEQEETRRRGLVEASKSGVKYQGYNRELADLSELEVELREPREILAGLGSRDLVIVTEDARAYAELEGADGEWLPFWTAFITLCEHERRDAERVEAARRRARLGGAEPPRRAVHGAVASELAGMFEGKSAEELGTMLRQVRQRVEAAARGATGDDPEYWEHVAMECEYAKANCELDCIHRSLLARQLEALQERRADEAAKAPADRKGARKRDEADDGPEEYDASTEAQAMAERERGRGFGEDEEQMAQSTEFALPAARQPAWAARYAPRKPRYLNRIKTGYEWNKYNQTHYSSDEPPPKCVQGYKFTLFYPDLVDATKPPTYKLEPCRDQQEFVILRFSAGAPYEDLAFKILNQEWEHQHKRGFRCVFERGILQLFFNFKRWRYRR